MVCIVIKSKKYLTIPNSISNKVVDKLTVCLYKHWINFPIVSIDSVVGANRVPLNSICFVCLFEFAVVMLNNCWLVQLSSGW